MNDNFLTYCFLIFGVGLVGGALPFIRKWSDDLLHLFVSFGAGIFIGTVFLHLLPEALSHEHAEISAIFVLVGFMLIFFIERFLFVKSDGSYDHSHYIASITALVGLSVHSLIAGLGFAVGAEYKYLGTLIFYSIIAHKSTAAFSLASLFLLAKIDIKKSILLIVMFSLMTPLGALFFSYVVKSVSHETLSPLLGLTAGTFLYVAVGELLPEVFHTKSHRWYKMLLLILGIVIMGLIKHGH